MPEFTQSWAFAFIIGCIVGGIITFIVTIIIAAGSMRSKAEERMEIAPNPTCKSCEYWEGRCEFNGPCPYNPLTNEVSIRIATQGKPEDG